VKVGIALGAPGAARAERALRAAMAELAAGNSVELFLVFGGVGLYRLAESEPAVAGLLDEALAAGLELSACRSCALAHGARRTIRCETSAFSHLLTMWRQSDRFIFIHRLRPAA
jgi:sulfur relay (sulfurtransferase) complex TusBCD TusD component (DsrE family)